MRVYSKQADSDEEDEVQSSLDVNSIARMSLKRRASDSYRAQLNVNGNHVKGRKGSLSPFVEVIVSQKVTLALYVCPLCSMSSRLAKKASWNLES